VRGGGGVLIRTLPGGRWGSYASRSSQEPKRDGGPGFHNAGGPRTPSFISEASLRALLRNSLSSMVMSIHRFLNSCYQQTVQEPAGFSRTRNDCPRTSSQKPEHSWRSMDLLCRSDRRTYFTIEPLSLIAERFLCWALPSKTLASEPLISYPSKRDRYPMK
jgi:hypothetical protein